MNRIYLISLASFSFFCLTGMEISNQFASQEAKIIKWKNTTYLNSSDSEQRVFRFYIRGLVESTAKQASAGITEETIKNFQESLNNKIKEFDNIKLINLASFNEKIEPIKEEIDSIINAYNKKEYALLLQKHIPTAQSSWDNWKFQVSTWKLIFNNYADKEKEAVRYIIDQKIKIFNLQIEAENNKYNSTTADEIDTRKVLKTRLDKYKKSTTINQTALQHFLILINSLEEQKLEKALKKATYLQHEMQPTRTLLAECTQENSCVLY